MDAREKYEQWWIRRLVEVIPPNLGWAAADDSGVLLQSFDEQPLVGDTVAPRILAALAAALARFGSGEELDVSYADAAASESFASTGTIATFVPLRLNARASMTFAEIAADAEQSLHVIREKGTYALDVYVRIPELLARATDPPLPVAISFNERFTHADGAVLTLQVLPGRWRWSFDPKRIEQGQVTALAAAVRRLLAVGSGDPTRPLRELPLLSESELETVTRTWNNTAAGPTDFTPVHVRFSQQAARAPDAIAVAGKREALSFATLERRSNQLARWLIRRGVGSETNVALWMERSPRWITAVVAIAKAGGVYCPLEPQDPEQRVRSILADAAPKLLLTTRALARADAIEPGTVEVIELDADAIVAELDREETTPPALRCDPSQLAYVIYTSGTTGVPNGVAVEHRQLSAFVDAHIRYTGLSAADRVSQMSSPAFDANISEVWPTLLAGAGMFIVDDALRMSLPDFARWLSAENITLVGMPTHMAQEALDIEWKGSSPRLLMTGGATLRRRPTETTRFAMMNSYGPTETTVYVTTEILEPGPQPVKTIGRPIGHTQAYVLAPDLTPLPAGIFGELWIGGANVARGYLGKPTLTAQKFVPNPFAAGRMYRTGDRARWHADGRLEFGGRVDHQVKLRGFRVELGEIESALAAQPGIAEAVVVVREDRPGEQRLVGYVVATSPTQPINVKALRSGLRHKLPAYMVPAAIVVLESLPRTSGGKPDRKALPVPAETRVDYIAPRNASERAVAEIWEQVFQIDRIGIHEDFYDVGGHSLIAMSLVRAVRDRLGVEIALIDVLESPTIAKLTVWIEEIRASEGMAPIVDRPQLRPSGIQRAKLPAPQRGAYKLDKHAPANAVNRFAWSVTLDGPLDEAALARALATLRERYALLRTRFHESGGDVWQEVIPADQAPVWMFVRHDLSSLEGEGQSAALAELLARYAERGFELAKGEGARCVLVKLGPERHRFAIWCHRVICDPEALEILTEELGRLWRAFTDDPTGDATTVLSPKPLQYIDLADYLARVDASPVGVAHLAYWREHLAGMPPLETLNDLPRAPVEARRVENDGFVSFPLARVTSAPITGDVLARIHAVATSVHASVASVLLAGVALHLHQMTGQQDLAFVSYLTYRHLQGLERAIGTFPNPLVMRVSAEGAPSFDELVARTHRVVTRGYEHGEFDVMSVAPYHAYRFCFNYMSTDARASSSSMAPVLPSRLTGVVTPLPAAQPEMAYDLILFASDYGDYVKLTLAYNCQLFTAARASSILAGYVDRIAAALQQG